MAYPSAANHKVTIKPNGASRFDTIDSPAIQCESAGSPDKCGLVSQLWGSMLGGASRLVSLTRYSLRPSQD